MKKFVENGALKERENGNIPYAEIISFVRKTEDFMEMLGVDTIEQLKSVFDEGFGKQQALITENIELKNELEKYKIKDTVGLVQFINKNSIKIAITELEKVKEQFSGYHLNGNSQKSVSLSRLYKIINNQIKNLKERNHE